VAKLLVLFDVATGMLLKAAAAPVRTHQMAKVGVLPPVLQRGDVLLADREFCSYAHLALLRKQGIFAVFRVHQKQLVDFTPDRPMAPRHSRGGHRPKRPHSRWVRALGDLDQIVIWYKPKSKPSWMSQDQFAALPAELEVRELRYRVETPGFRTSTITLVTTLLDAKIYPAAELADLYFRRWQVEVNLKHLKISMKMDVLRCETMAGVTQELMMFALAYNLVRSVMVASAQAQGVSPERISLLDTLRWLTGTEGTNPSQTKVNPKRPGRIEPRAVKRRPKQYALLNKPRQELRKELIKKEVAA
jgi:hypothetical protein